MLSLYTQIIDFGLVVLIWITQLVIYPGFQYYDPKSLLRWHGKYTSAISIIVMPLMLGQLILHTYWIWLDLSFIRLISLVLIGLAWINTFLFAVPLHNKISKNDDVVHSVKKLIQINWYRTFFWSIVFVLGFFS